MTYPDNKFTFADQIHCQEPVAVEHRSGTGVPAADAAPASLARSGYIECKGYASVLFYWLATGGASPTVDIEPLILDEESDCWISTSKITAIPTNKAVEIPVNGARMLVRIDAASAVGVSAWQFILKPWDVRLEN
jgi:hypothetical protein